MESADQRIQHQVDAEIKMQNDPDFQTTIEPKDLFDYREYFEKWNKSVESDFSSFVIWCIHTEKGREFIKTCWER